MKKFFSIICAVILICSCTYIYDVCSGFKITIAIDELMSNKIVDVYDDSAEGSMNISDCKIMYNQLSDEDKKVYDTIFKALSNHRSKAYITTVNDSEHAFEIVKCVLSDHPEIFYFSGKCVFYTNGILEFTYDYTKQETNEIKARIDSAVNEALPIMESKKTPYEKSLCAFEWIISNTTYDSENLDKVGELSSISNIDGVFLNHKAVCTGYAKAYQYLLNRLGIPAVMVTGDATENDKAERHAWVCQELGEEYYFSDPTWGDSYEKSISNEFISHTYFCINSSQLNVSHTPDERYDFISSDAEKYNYFYKEGLALDEYSASKIREIVKTAIVNGDKGFELYFPNDSIYNEAKYRLIDKGEIYIYLKSVDLLSLKIDSSSVQYNTNDKQNVIMFAFKDKE